MRIILFFWLISWLLQFVHSEITDILCPTVGRVFDGSSGSATVLIRWKEDGSSIVDDKYHNESNYTFTLVTGPNNDITEVRTLQNGTGEEFYKINKLELKIPNNSCSDGVYFIQILTTTKFGFAKHYSQRFKLVGMNGDIPSVDIAPPPAAQTRIITSIRDSVEHIGSTKFGSATVSGSFSCCFTRYPNSKTTLTKRKVNLTKRAGKM